MMVLVTGANGFIGRALCSKILLKGWQVRGTIRDVVSLPEGVDAINIKSIGIDTNWASALKGVDVVVHLAARVHVLKETTDNPLYEFRKINVAGTKRLVEEAALNGVKRFIYISSIGVNSNKTLNNPFTEKDLPSPYDPYTISKWEAEQALQKIAKDSGMEIVILRPPLIYGPNAPGNFGRLMKIIGKDIPLPLSSIKNLRSFIYLGNFIDVIIKCIKHPSAAYQTFLVSDDQDISTPHLIRMIANAMGKKPRLLPCPPFLLKALGKITGKGMEVERLIGYMQIDSSKIRNVLGWKPPFTLEEGIAETVKWYLKRF